MKHNIKQEKFNEFKEYLSEKVTKETGIPCYPNQIFVADEDKIQYEILLTNEEEYKFIFGDVSIGDRGDSEKYIYTKKDIENLQYISGDFKNFNNQNLESLGSLNYIGGRLLIKSSKLKNFGELKEIGENLIIKKNHSLKYLGNNLKKIKKNLLIEYSDVESLGSIEYVGGGINLKGCKLKDIGNLKYVGGFIIMSDEQAEIFGDKVYKDGQHYYFRNEIAKDQEFEI